MTSDAIRWPPGREPASSAVHVVNALSMAASPEAVWRCLIAAPDWPDWYPNAANVRLLDAPGDVLAPGVRFRWKTFGMTITCQVEEFEPFERLAWSSDGFGMHVYHAWLITPRTDGEPGRQGEGCHVLTEETQNGFIPRLGAMLMPGRMHKFHQIWLEQLAARA